MRTPPRFRTLRAALTGLGLVVACGRPDLPPLQPEPLQDDDRYDIARPAERHRDDYYDVLDYTVFRPIGELLDVPRQLRRIPGKPRQARNVTAFDEVQDSSWWTNRIGKQAIAADAMRQGPNRPLGPDAHSTWTIVRAKTEGVTPGFTIVDGRGDSYVIKFDPFDEPELATGAEVISSRLFWAIGYHVPENYIVHFDPDILQIDAKATVPQHGKRVPMQPLHLRTILDKVPRLPDGRMRALASRYLDGKPIGPFSFHGTRGDDPNDVIAHEHRRELRAYRVFAAWVNHNDCRAINTLDTFVQRGDRGYVQHNLIDFGATLGSRSYSANLRSEGHEYLWDFGITTRSLLTLGLDERSWLSHEYEVYRGSGRFTSAYFSPRHWKPDYPNPAFDNLTDRDAFWAAKIILRFDDALIDAAVSAAEYSDPRATALVARVLRERRDRIGETYVARANALDNFRLVSPDMTLQWDDLAVHYGYWTGGDANGAGPSARVYHVQLYPPGGARSEHRLQARELDLGDAIAAVRARSAAGERPDDAILQVEIQSALGNAAWTPACRVSVYVPPTGPPRIVGVVREQE